MADEKTGYTLSDIARDLGVNKATVSKALSGKGSLSPETRARIVAFADACGYHPNAAAQSLARNRSYNLGLMMPEDSGTLDQAFFRECLGGVCAVASEGGYDVLMVMDSENSKERIARVIDRRKVDGVIAMRSLVSSPVADFLRQKRVPFVIIGPTSDTTVCSVDNDNLGACRELTARLIAQGVRSMALLGGDDSNCVTHSRLKGFWEACSQAGLSGESQLIYLNVRGGHRLEEAIDTALARKAACILCMDDYICNMALIYLRSAGVEIPRDVKLVSFYDSPLLEHNIPPVTSLRFDATELGAIACRKLIAQLEGSGQGDFTLPGYRIMQRESSR